MGSTKEYKLTSLLLRWQKGDPLGVNHQFSIIYSELRKIARSQLRNERAQSFQTDLLVNEAFLRLQKQIDMPWKSRYHFFAVATHAIRQYLVEKARARNALKRGQGKANLPLDRIQNTPATVSPKTLELNEALNELKKVDPRKAAVIELRFDVGLTNEQIAALLQTSVATVKRDWDKAKVWLRQKLEVAPKR